MSNVYKTIEGNTLIVVDDYIESKNDQTKRDDTEAFSGKYKIVEEKDSGMSKYQVFERNALREGRECVPESAIRRMYSQFEEPSFEEGFETIYTVDAFGGIEIRRK